MQHCLEKLNQKFGRGQLAEEGGGIEQGNVAEYDVFQQAD